VRDLRVVVIGAVFSGRTLGIWCGAGSAFAVYAYGPGERSRQFRRGNRPYSGMGYWGVRTVYRWSQRRWCSEDFFASDAAEFVSRDGVLWLAVQRFSGAWGKEKNIETVAAWRRAFESCAAGVEHESAMGLDESTRGLLEPRSGVLMLASQYGVV